MSRSDWLIAVLCGIALAVIYKVNEVNHRKNLHLLVLVEQARAVAEVVHDNAEVSKLEKFAERAATEFDLDHYED